MDRGRIVRDFALAAIDSPYVYGGTGHRCIPAYRERLMAQYPAYEEAIREACPRLMGRLDGCAPCRYAGKSCYDCAQLVRRAFGAAGIHLPSGASTQWKAGNWAHQGLLGREAISQVCALYRAGGDPRRPMRHTGISLGDGRVVDARSHRAGVLLSRIEDYPWTHYAIPRGMQAESLPAYPAPLMKRGSRGERVRALQTRLMALGLPLPRYGADGVFGRETARALRAFQHMAGIAPSGVACETTLKMLDL
jgi:hypothetical protein